MAGLKLSHIYKVYPNGVKAVNDFSMEIADKEFIVFVGPSGCGKSTTLRMIAGLEEITAGRLQIDGKEVNDVEPKDRDIAMVFQNYALYPHLTVYQNMALGLKLRKIEKNEIDRRVAQAAQILDITDYLNRRPKELSGGQRQRVALGRAIVREPKVFLLDEPLSNLDAKLRTTMRAEIAKIHKRVGTTFVYVTHDQTEAMTMGTRIVVMKEGVIQQIDSPLNLYRHPCNKFVAGFIGTPQMNFFDASLAVKGDKVVVHVKGTNQSLTIDRQILVKVHASNFDGRQVIVGIRPEHFCLQDKPSELSLQAEVSHIEELGTECLVYTEICNGCRAVVKAPTGTQLQMGQTVNICMDQHFVHLFDAKSENSIIPQIPISAQVDCKVEDGVLSIGNYSVELPKHIAVASATLQADIPTTAVSVDGSHKADCVLCEKQDNKNLLHLTLDGQTIFALAENDIAQPKIDIDIRQLTIFSDGKEVVQPLACNKLQATLLGKKVVERNQKNKKITQWQYFLNIVGSQIALPNHIALHIVKAVGQNVFKEELRLEIHPDNMQIDSCGIPAQIDSIVSYGNLQYAICKAQGVEICCKISDELAVGDKIFANPDLDFAKIFEVKREIRIN